jgi:hypothetical protein
MKLRTVVETATLDLRTGDIGRIHLRKSLRRLSVSSPTLSSRAHQRLRFSAGRGGLRLPQLAARAARYDAEK